MNPRTTRQTTKRTLVSLMKRFGNLANYTTRKAHGLATFADLEELPVNHDTLAVVFGHESKTGASVKADGWRFIEGGRYASGHVYGAFYCDGKSQAYVDFSGVQRPPIKDLFVCAFFTADEPYKSMALDFVKHYGNSLPGKRIGVGVRVGIALYGFEDAESLALQVAIDDGNPRLMCRRDAQEKWDEAKAGNELRVLADESKCSHTLRLDGDTLIAPGELRRIMRQFSHVPSRGIVNLKSDPSTGPGLLLAETDVFTGVAYAEDWPARFYHIDTEYTWEQCRQGRCPTIVFANLGRKDHWRPHGDIQQENMPMLADIMKNGRGC